MDDQGSPAPPLTPNSPLLSTSAIDNISGPTTTDTQEPSPMELEIDREIAKTMERIEELRADSIRLKQFNSSLAFNRQDREQTTQDVSGAADSLPRPIQVKVTKSDMDDPNFFHRLLSLGQEQPGADYVLLVRKRDLKDANFVNFILNVSSPHRAELALLRSLLAKIQYIVQGEGVDNVDGVDGVNST